MHLGKWQGDNCHDPEFNVAVFDDESEAESLVARNFACIDPQRDIKFTGTTYRDPSGFVIDIGEDFAPYATLKGDSTEGGAGTLSGIIRKSTFEVYYHSGSDEATGTSTYRPSERNWLVGNEAELEFEITLVRTAAELTIDGESCELSVVTGEEAREIIDLEECGCPDASLEPGAPCNVSASYAAGSVHDPFELVDVSDVEAIQEAIDALAEAHELNIVVDVRSEECVSYQTLAVAPERGGDSISILVLSRTDANLVETSVVISCAADLEEKIGEAYVEYLVEDLYDGEFAGYEFGRRMVAIIGALAKPAPGDPLRKMLVVHPSNRNTVGGYFGCVRNQVTPNCDRYANGNIPTYSGKNKGHDGVDLRATVSTEIFSMFEGEVMLTLTTVPFATDDPSHFGNKVRIKHDWQQYGGQPGDPDIITYYTHMNDVSVGVGDVVEAGELIGHTGNTGNASRINEDRYHSHIVVFRGSPTKANVVDPSEYFHTRLCLINTF